MQWRHKKKQQLLVQLEEVAKLCQAEHVTQKARKKAKAKVREEAERRRRKRECQSTSNNSRTRCQRKMLLFWKMLKNSRLQNLSTRKYSQKTIQTASLLKRLKKNNQQSTVEILGSRQGVLTSVRDVCMLGRTTWYTIQGE